MAFVPSVSFVTEYVFSLASSLTFCGDVKEEYPQESWHLYIQFSNDGAV